MSARFEDNAHSTSAENTNSYKVLAILSEWLVMAIKSSKEAANGVALVVGLELDLDQPATFRGQNYSNITNLSFKDISR